MQYSQNINYYYQLIIKKYQLLVLYAINLYEEHLTRIVTLLIYAHHFHKHEYNA